MAREKMQTKSIQLSTQMWDYYASLSYITNESVSNLIRTRLSVDIRSAARTFVRNFRLDRLQYYPKSFIEELSRSVSILVYGETKKYFTSKELYDLFNEYKNLLEATRDKLEMTIDYEDINSLCSWMALGKKDNETKY